ncbi:hypothetical protein B0H12DRAFT_1068793 [Mycena haematopus]|nr:hypothetical protein B0H12DRAFT_1068793 [Mycena haematopus]
MPLRHPPTLPYPPRIQRQTTNRNLNPTLKPLPRQAIDMTIFGQILELDDDDTHEFSKEMVSAFFLQASTTFDDMNKALALSQGLVRRAGHPQVQDACEKIQHYGDLRDEVADKDLSPTEALDKIRLLLAEVKTEFTDAERWLKKWYKDNNAPFDEEEDKAP